jgi:hypothetical protein
MNRRWMYAILLVFLLSFLLIAGLASAQVVAGSYSLSWWSVDGGGGSSSASAYSLSGSAGQADAGSLSGSGYRLNGGFWIVPSTSPAFQIYLPLAIR